MLATLQLKMNNDVTYTRVANLLKRFHSQGLPTFKRLATLHYPTLKTNGISNHLPITKKQIAQQYGGDNTY
jgi:hypothetical protein